nr:serine/threonine protein kinase [Verrucomicrobiota bacterium]
MIQAFPPISDSPAGVLDNPTACKQCGATIRAARGTCVNCLLLGATEDEGESSSEEFERVLSEADVSDTHWHLGNYQILGEIGRGGMGVIYRARQRHSRRIVALKRVLGYHADSHERLHRFRREVEAAASLDHPNILPVYEVGQEDGSPFFSMKWATGGSLRDVAPSLRNNPHACVQLMAKVARAIDYAHGKGILHRDLQPGNILLDSRGEPQVSDFGLAKMVGEESDLTRTVTTFGTPGFIAPEQAEGRAADLTPAADIYSLGAIFFHLLSGRPPFLGTNPLSVLRQAADEPAPRLRSIVHS